MLPAMTTLRQTGSGMVSARVGRGQPKSGMERERAGKGPGRRRAVRQGAARHLEACAPDEIFIDQHWPSGDALVRFPGYDIKILPPSGGGGKAVIEMFVSERHEIENCC